MSDSLFGALLPKLRAWKSEVVQALGDSKNEQGGLRLKREIGQAIALLEFCQRYDIRPGSKVLVVPEPSTMSPSSEYRLIEDNETDEREQWIEAKADGEFIRPLPGSLIIESPRRTTSAS
jgi:hypothetical protein